jgi:hypothetical protein
VISPLIIIIIPPSLASGRYASSLARARGRAIERESDDDDDGGHGETQQIE